MKQHARVVGAALLLVALVSSCTTMGTRGGGAVQVSFQSPEQFTDLRRTHLSGGRGADEGYLRELQDYVERIGPQRIPAGYTLALTITDVDMAGDFEPERGPSFMDVRITRGVYPPRINLTYRLTDTTGAVRSQGERQLRNQAFDWTISAVDRNDPLRHEKDLLNDILAEIASVADSAQPRAS